MKKAAFGIVKTGVILGAGASITSGAGAVGIGNMAAHLPTAGTVAGSGVVLGMLKGLGKK